MSAWWTLYKRELMGFFLSPVAYIFAFVTHLILGWSFLWVLSILTNQNVELAQQQLMAVFLGGNIFFWIYLILLATVLTMRLFAEEKRSGTIEALMTTPVTDLQVVLAKFMGTYTFYVLLWAPTVLYFVLAGSKALDWRLLGSAYLSILLLGGVFVSVGCLASALCVNQFVAAILCAMVLMILSFVPLMATGKAVEQEVIKTCIEYVNLLPFSDHSMVGDFNRGLVTVAHLVYPLSLTACALFLTARVLASRSWK